MATNLANLSVYRQKNTEVALVLVHGFMGHPEKTWGDLPKWLMSDTRLNGWDVFGLGYPTTLALDVVGIWSANPPLVSIADTLRTDAATLLASYKSIALVAHSMGGLVVQRSLVDDPAFAQRVSHVTLFGTPSGGLEKAWWGQFWKRQIRNMAHDSEFITDVRKRWTQQFGDHPPFVFRAVAGDQDEFVPRGSSIEPFPMAQRDVVPGNHIEIVKPDAVSNLSVQVLLKEIAGDAAPAGPWSAARIAVESREFQRAIDRFWPNRDSLDESALVQLALALESVGRQADAIQVLESAQRRGKTDAMGVLAGRLKRRWMVDHIEADAQLSRQLYDAAYQLSVAAGNHSQAFYHGINVAFMDLTFGASRDAAKAKSSAVLDHCAKATRDKWCMATEGEARLVLGETDQAIAAYRDAVRQNPTPRQLRSMYQQAVLVARQVNNEAAEKSLASVFKGGDL